MKKNKKLFAILTLVAFMMTLMPVMAFAAENDVIAAPTVFAAGTNNGYQFNATVSVSGASASVYEVTGENVAVGATPVVTVTASGTTATFDNVALVEGKTYCVIEGQAAGAGAASAPQTNVVTGQTFTKANADAVINKAINVSSSVQVTDVDDSQSNVTVTLGLASATTGDAEYTVKFGGVAQTAKIIVAEGAVTGSHTYSVDKTGVEQTIAVTVEFGGAAATGSTSQNAVIPASKATATLNAWNAYKADHTDATKFTTFKTAQAAAPLTGADANKAAVIADCSSASIAQAYFEAGTAYDDLKTNVSTTTLADFKAAYAAITPAKLAKFVNVSESTLKSINETSNLETVSDLLSGGGSTTDPTPVNPTSGTPSAYRSVISTVESNESINTRGAGSDKTAAIQIVMNNAAGQRVIPTNQTVYVWATESGTTNVPSDAFRLYTDANCTIEASFHDHADINNAAGQAQYGRIYKIDNINDNVTTLHAQFERGGTYTLKASFVNPYDSATKAIVSNLQTLQNDTNRGTIKATAPAANTRLWFLTGAYGLDDGSALTTITTSKANDVLVDGATTSGAIRLQANNVTTTKVELTLYNQNGGTVGNYPIKLSTNSANIELSETTVTTGNLGTATFNVAGVREGTYKIYVNFGDYESILLVQVGSTAATDLTLTKFPSNPIATDTLVSDYASIFRIMLTDAAGNIVTDNYPEGALNATADGSTGHEINDVKAKYVSIVSAPEANKVKDAEVVLGKVANKDYYTLKVLNNKSFEAEGRYEVKVVLDNGRSVTIPFEVKKFDKAVNLSIEYPTSAVELNAFTDAPDIYFTDANGVTKKANNRVTVAATGYAVASVNVNKLNQTEIGVIKVKNDEKYLGETITVSAVAEKENLVATTTLTVTDSAQSIKLDSTRGQVNANNRIGFKLVNSNGQAVALGNDTIIDDVTCIVTNTGDPDAKVSFSVSGTTKSDLQSNGTGVINLSSNKETTATVQIMIKATKSNVATNNAGDNNTGLSTTYYTGTETFTFGAEADKSVVMTIGSNEIVANNVPTSIDVAPFIQDNRTWVPFRALVEAFGAEVEYNAENNTVTTKLAGKTVVMTVGSNVMTVNDEAVTMDVAPFIVDDRVVVPVRFVGEAFGFTVEAIADAVTGATASVVFYQK